MASRATSDVGNTVGEGSKKRTQGKSAMKFTSPTGREDIEARDPDKPNTAKKPQGGPPGAPSEPQTLFDDAQDDATVTTERIVTIRRGKASIVLPHVVATLRVESGTTYAQLRRQLGPTMGDGQDEVFGLPGGRLVNPRLESTLEVRDAEVVLVSSATQFRVGDADARSAWRPCLAKFKDVAPADHVAEAAQLHADAAKLEEEETALVDARAAHDARLQDAIRGLGRRETSRRALRRSGDSAESAPAPSFDIKTMSHSDLKKLCRKHKIGAEEDPPFDINFARKGPMLERLEAFAQTNDLFAHEQQQNASPVDRAYAADEDLRTERDRINGEAARLAAERVRLSTVEVRLRATRANVGTDTVVASASDPDAVKTIMRDLVEHGATLEVWQDRRRVLEDIDPVVGIGHVSDDDRPAHSFEVRLSKVLTDAGTARARVSSQFYCPQCRGSSGTRGASISIRLLARSTPDILTEYFEL